MSRFSWFVMVALVLPCFGFVQLRVEAQTVSLPITAQMQGLIEEQRAVMERMNARGMDRSLRPFDDKAMAPLLNKGWELAGKWAVAWFDLHPDPSAKALESLFVEFTPPQHDPEIYDPKLPDVYSLEGSATRIAVDVYAVRAGYYESQAAVATSTFFVVARDAKGRFAAKWSIEPLAERHYRLRDELGLWAFHGSCAYYCGPLVVERVIPLPPTEEGQPRFAIDAFQATNGNTRLKQLSVWQWNGTEARNLLIRSYRLYIDEDRDIQILGNLLTVPTKETTSSFSAYGCCAEPRGIWMIRVTADKVEDLGHHFVQPQIQWVDRLLEAVKANSPRAAEMASPSVLARLRREGYEMDVIDQCRVLRSGKKGAFEISLDEGATLWLAYRLRNGQPYFMDIRIE